jgi:iron complex transport system ATP-binding protein
MFECTAPCFTAHGNNVSFSLRSGEIIALIGPSASGKSYYLSAFAGLIKGAVVSHQNTRLSKKDLQKQTTINPSGLPVDDDISVYETLLYSRSLYKRLFSSYSQLDRQIVEEMIEAFNLGEYSETILSQLPDSIYKKTILAFSFSRMTPLLLLDNPDTALDLAGIQSLQRILQKHILDGSRTILFATHDITFAAQNADRIIMLGNGEIKGIVPYDAINDNMLRNLFGVDLQVTRNVYNGRPEVRAVPPR